MELLTCIFVYSNMLACGVCKSFWRSENGVSELGDQSIVRSHRYIFIWLDFEHVVFSLSTFAHSNERGYIAYLDIMVCFHSYFLVLTFHDAVSLRVTASYFNDWTPQSETKLHVPSVSIASISGKHLHFCPTSGVRFIIILKNRP